MPTRRATVGTVRCRTVPWCCRPCASGVLPACFFPCVLQLVPQRFVRFAVVRGACAQLEPSKRSCPHDACGVDVGVVLVRAAGAPEALGLPALRVDASALGARVARVHGGELERSSAPGFDRSGSCVLGHAPAASADAPVEPLHLARRQATPRVFALSVIVLICSDSKPPTSKCCASQQANLRMASQSCARIAACAARIVSRSSRHFREPFTQPFIRPCAATARSRVGP